ncbi:MAG: VanZ family protein [Oscillospiraceae bacterium]|nr:VanZ family protein [Oscillospiraceae bacterium]
MERTSKKLRLCTALLILNIGFIWGNSLLPGELSGAFSGWVRDLLAAIFPGGPEDPDAGHGLLRKIAHFTEFACLGALLTWLFAMVQRPRALALLCGFLVASGDETIQRFVPERGPSFRDVLIDTAGVTAGILLLLAGYAILKHWRTQRSEKMDCVAAGDDNGSVGGGLQEKACRTIGVHRRRNGANPAEDTADRHHGGECQ